MQHKALSVFMLAMINVAAICNIANLPVTAQYGFASLFYYAFGALFFFIPVGLISAELATGWPESGGVYVWVREALGEKAGFVAIWMQWTENVIWYPTTLSYTAATLAYLIDPKLAQNKIYIMLTVLIVFWSMTFINFLGMKVSGWISTLCVIIGIFIPAASIIIMGILWIILGNPSEISFNATSFFPDLSSFGSLSILAGIFLIFGGLEMSAVHAKDVDNPKKNYPLAIGLSTIIILLTLSLAALSIAIVVPKEKIELASGTIEGIRYFLDHYHLSWVLPVLSVLMVVGALGTVSTWLIGPSKGLLATARHGELPPLLQKTNKKNMPISILIVQAVIVTFLSSIFLYLPTVSSSYQVFFSLTAQQYLVMYILLFISGIVLRYKRPDVTRVYKVPFKNIGMWIVGSMGLISSLFAMFFGFFPPKNFARPYFYVIFLILGTLIFVLIPLIIHKMRKPHWHIHANE